MSDPESGQQQARDGEHRTTWPTGTSHQAKLAQTGLSASCPEMRNFLRPPGWPGRQRAGRFLCLAAPVAEGGEEVVASFGGEGFRGESAELADGGAELVEGGLAAFAFGDVLDEAGGGGGGEGAVVEGGDGEKKAVA